ncbi:MAG: DMT family transporter, partial [Candidatus Pacearchaeota archaeon]
MIYTPIIGALALAGGTILEKVILMKRKINIRLYQTSSFLAIVLVMIPLLYFFWNVESAALQTKNIFIFGLVILFSIVANLFTFYSMKWEKITTLEPAKILEPLFVILLAIGFSFFFEGLYDRNVNVIVPALIASFALVFSHIKKHHLSFNKYFIAAIFGSFFFGLELVVSRLILDYYSPISFYFLRCASIFLISFAAFRPKFKNIDGTARKEILVVGIIWVVYRVMIYYGYLSLGVIFTTLIVMLGPMFVYIFAWKFLHEKLDWRNIVAAV